MENTIFTKGKSENGNNVLIMTTAEGKEIFGTPAISAAMTKDQLMDWGTMEHIYYLVSKHYTAFKSDALLEFDTARAKMMTIQELMDVDMMKNIISIIALFEDQDYIQRALLTYDKARANALQVHDFIDDETWEHINDELIKLCEDDKYQSEAHKLYETARKSKINQLIKQVLNGNFAAARYMASHPELATSAWFINAIEEYIHEHQSAVKVKKLRKLDVDTAKVIQDTFGIKW